MLDKIIDFLPMKKNVVKDLIEEFESITHTVIYAQLFVALIQGLVATIGFYLLGVPFPLIFGVLVAFCALIPAVETSIIWFPASMYLILVGYFSQEYWILGKGIILFFYGLLIISTIDNFLLVKIVRSKAKISQITTITGVIGGASMFGLLGIFIGPILLPLLISYFKTFKEKLI